MLQLTLIRMVFVVMIPMITGPYIGRGVSMINEETYIDPDYGISSIKPNSYIFLFTAVVLMFVIIPLIFLLKEEKKNEQAAE